VAGIEIGSWRGEGYKSLVFVKGTSIRKSKSVGAFEMDIKAQTKGNGGEDLHGLRDILSLK